MFEAHYSYLGDFNKTTHKFESKKGVLSGENASEFMKHIERLRGVFELKDCRNCSIDGIKVKPGHFIAKVKEEMAKAESRRFKEVDPFQHFGFTQLEIDLYGLKKAGHEILVRKPANEDLFFKKLEDTKEGPIVTLYHGTNARNIKSILGSGLQASRQGAFGRGLYVGPMEKARGYNGKDGLRTKWNQKRNYFATIFELDVILGKCIKASQLDGYKWRDQYDSVYYDGFRNPEYCLRDAHQVLIKKIILL